MSKVFWKSRTMIVNIVIIIGIILQHEYKTEIFDTETQAAIIAFVNIILRFITTKKITAV